MPALVCVAMHATAQEKTSGSDLDFQRMAQIQAFQVNTTVKGLSSEQQSKILSIEQNFTRAMVNAHNSSDGNEEVMHTLSNQLHMDRDAKMKAVMTSSQYAQYQKMLAANRALATQDGPVK